MAICMSRLYWISARRVAVRRENKIRSAIAHTPHGAHDSLGESGQWRGEWPVCHVPVAVGSGEPVCADKAAYNPDTALSHALGDVATQFRSTTLGSTGLGDQSLFITLNNYTYTMLEMPCHAPHDMLDVPTSFSLAARAASRPVRAPRRPVPHAPFHHAPRPARRHAGSHFGDRATLWRPLGQIGVLDSRCASP